MAAAFEARAADAALSAYLAVLVAGLVARLRAEGLCPTCGAPLAEYAGPGRERGWTCVRCAGGAS